MSTKDDYITHAIVLLKEAEKNDQGSDYRMLNRVVTARRYLEEALEIKEPVIDLLKQVEDNFRRRHVLDMVLDENT